MRMLRFAAVAVLFAIPVMVAATPAAYAASADRTDPATDSASTGTSIAFATPSTASPGEKVTFTVDCAAGTNAGAASAILDGSTLGLAPQIPMNPINGSLTDFNITVMLPRNIQAGAYDPLITCPGGAPSANADLVVTRVPRGGAATGDGTTSTTGNSGLAVAGPAMIGGRLPPGRHSTTADQDQHGPAAVAAAVAAVRMSGASQQRQSTEDD